MKTKPQRGEQMKIRVPDDVHAWLKQQTQAQERSMNWLVNKLLAQAMEAQHAKQA